MSDCHSRCEKARHRRRPLDRVTWMLTPRLARVFGVCVVLTLAAIGCEGLAGKQGLTGAAGAQGEVGARGEQGEKGTKGTSGKAGADGKNGAKGGQGTAGATGEKGTPGDAATAKGKLQGIVLAAKTGKPVAGVTISAKPGDLSVKTGGKGDFDFGNIAIGAYTLTFVRSGFVTKIRAGVGVTALTTHQLTVLLQLDPVTGATPTVQVSDHLDAGFDATITLTAIGDDPDGDNTLLTYTWKQITGKTLSLKNGATATATIQTLGLTASKALQAAAFGVVGLTPMDVGRAVFEVTVTDPDGHTGQRQVVVQAARPTAGLANVAIGVPVWLTAGATTAPGTSPNPSYGWSLDVTNAKTSKATLSTTSKQFVRFTPDIKGTYVLKESVSGRTIKVYAGTWSGVAGAQGSCTPCHNGSLAPDKFTPWSKTAHAVAMSNGLDGKRGATFTASCLGCHTVGSSPADNGGFDDLNTAPKWSFTAPAPGTWDKLQSARPSLAKLGNVQCESCHGPQSSSAHFKHSPRVSWGSAVCATCHQRAPSYNTPAQWAKSAHASPKMTLFATVENAGVQAAHCARCHAAQGFARYADQLYAGNAGVLTKSDGTAADEKSLRARGLQRASVQPITCSACHDPHGNGNVAQLRLAGELAALPSGLSALKGVGTGAVCMACHSTWVGEHSDFAAANTTWDAASPAAETDVLYGFNAYFMPRHTPSPHLAIKNTCVGCHLTAGAIVSAAKSGDHGFKADLSICASCHGKQVNGKGLQGAVQTQLSGLRQAIGLKARALVSAAITTSGKVEVRAWNPKSKLFSSKSGLKVVLTVAPKAMEPASIALRSGWRLSLPSAIDVTWSDGSQSKVGDLFITSADLRADGKPLFTPTHLLIKASWNHRLLVEDGSGGIHNPAFYQAVIAATHAALK